MHRVSDRPGRYLAAFVIGPSAVVGGVLLCTCDLESCRVVVGVALVVFGPLLSAYEMFWICTTGSELTQLGKGDCPPREQRARTV